MKKLLFIISIIPVLALGQSQDQNYVKTTVYKTQTSTPLSNPSVTDANIQIGYYDGLGRPIQQIAHQQSNSGNDIITHVEYDQYGRQIKEYLPYPNSAPSLNYVDATSVASDLNSFYSSYNGGTTNPYSEKVLESSPLDRILKQAAPGDDWVMGSGKEIKFEYQSNDFGEVKQITATATWNGSLYRYDITANYSGTYYASNQLYKTITKDENWTSGLDHTTEEFKNKDGQVILKRTYESEIAHDTYYVYDQYGNLTYVIPPLASSKSITPTLLDDLCYQYMYDYRNRLVQKKLPGKDWEYMVYNTQDMVVATGPVYNPWGDNYPTEKGWLITKYDVFGRVAYTGYYTGRAVNETERANYQVEQKNEPQFFEEVSSGYSFDGIVTDYTNKVKPTTGFRLLTIAYYDDYSNSNAPSLPSDVEGQSLATHTKGLLTGSWVRVLDDQSNTTAEVSYTLYDDKFRPIRTNTTNYLGGYTQVDSKLDWAGKLDYTVTKHKYNTSATELVVTDTYEYTDQDRLTLHKQQINSFPEELISSNTYDELGQLISKNVGGDASSPIALQTVDYSYNIRGWLTDINDVNDVTGADLFAFKINYNNPSDSNVDALYNGNISETFWRSSSDNILRKYDYTYDALNRLTNADYSKPENSTWKNSYWESISYDKNGNILTLNRNGDLDADDFKIEVDDLTYTYHSTKSNQLMKVFDSSNHPYGLNDDSDGISDPDDDFDYDSNGNMIKDDNKGIASIVYNHLNLPTEILFGTSGKITYLYNASGAKIKKHVISFVSNLNTVTDYMNGVHYTDGKLSFRAHDEGYTNFGLTRTGSVFAVKYVYNYTDHLGNVRLSYTKHPFYQNAKEVLEENHYYPFGLKHSKYNSATYDFVEVEDGDDYYVGIEQVPAGSRKVYQYKYNGKEYQDELGLNMYDYGARNYDPALGRWMNIDPLAEQTQELYSYVWNSPVMMIDPDGRSGESTIVEDIGDGKYKVVGGDLNDGDKGIYVVNKNDKGEYVRTGEKLGESLTMYSFYNADTWDADEGKKIGWVGTIDTNSNESGKLVSDFMKEADNIFIGTYMPNATDGKKYDFKRNGDPNNEDRDYHHRGSKWGVKMDGTQVYGTARDAGNYAAGYIAGINNLNWFTARLGFDGLEFYSSGNTEGLQSTLAQKLGHNRGYPIGQQRAVEREIQKLKSFPTGPLKY